MAQEPLHAGVRRLLEAARNEEWTLDRSLGADRECPTIREKVEPGTRRDHPQYVWREVVNYAARGPLVDYAEWHHAKGRGIEAIGVLSRWYEAVRGAPLPTKALSDASYDLACGLARAGRSDDAMRYLPDAFSYNDKAAVPVLKAWARTDRDLSQLGDRADFRTLVGA
jgi:hypothetical protein